MAREIGTLRTRLSFEDEGATRTLEDLRRDLRGLGSEMNAARARGREYTSSLRGLREQSDILTRRLKTQREQVAELRRRYEESRRTKGEDARETRNLSRQYNNAVAAMRRTEQQLKGVTAEIERQINPWRRLSEAADRHGRNLQTIGRGVARFGRAYTMRVTTPILGAAAAALKVGMDFEEGMSRVQAISGATGSELEALSAQARELGATTRFSATEAASGMEFLAMAGFETNEILAAMPGLLDLAAASGMDLGRTADITSNILSGFNYEAGEAGRVADVLAKGAATANTNVEQLGDAMKYASPVASTLGLEIEGVTAAVGFMSDAGIQGQQAGRMLRQGMLRLADPTGKAASLIEELGINVFDAEGNMKEMHEIVAELEKGLEGMDAKTRAAALSTIFGSQSTAGWSVLLDRGSKELAKYTKELEDSEGAASDMAKTMEDNAKGAMREFRSAAEEAGIAISAHMIPAVTDLIRKGTELVRKFGELDDEQQQQIIKWGLIAAAIGPVSVGVGNLIVGVGGLLRFVSMLSGAIAGAGGLTAALTGLLNPVTLAIAGIGALGIGVYKYYESSREAKKISTETADALLEQAEALEPNITRFEELQLTSRLTADEFGRLIDIQSELNETQNPARVAELKDEYDALREKSGLTNEELNEMIGLNNDIIEQSPIVEQTFTDKGNAVVESTDAVRDYTQSLRDMAFEELQIERVKALEREADLRKENKQINEEIAEVEKHIQDLIKMREMPLEQVEARLEEINKELNTGLLTSEEYVELQREQGLLLQIQHGTLVEALERLQEQRSELLKKKELNEEELAKLDQINERMADLLLSEVDLNFEKGKGLEKLDEKIKKLKEERNEILDNMTEDARRHGLYDDHLQQLNESIRKHESIRNQIRENTGYQSEMNRAAGLHDNWAVSINRRLTETRNRISDNTSAQVGTNREIAKGTGEAREMTRELGKDVKKDVKVDDRGTAARVQREAEKSATKRVTLRAIWSGVTSGLTAAIARVRIPGFAEGTSFAPGGPALVGEEGPELARLGSRWAMLDFGVANLPRGTQVFTHDETKKIVQALNRMPAFADGARPFNEADRVVAQLEQPNGQVINQYITINSPDPTSPSENARKIKQASRQLAMEAGW